MKNMKENGVFVAFIAPFVILALGVILLVFFAIGMVDNMESKHEFVNQILEDEFGDSVYTEATNTTSLNRSKSKRSFNGSFTAIVIESDKRIEYTIYVKDDNVKGIVNETETLRLEMLEK